MALAVPTTASINATIIAQLEASLSQTIPLLPKAFSRVLSKALAGVFILVYKYAGFMFLQLFVAFAQNRDTEINGTTVNPLQAWGVLIGVGLPDDATQAELVISVTVNSQTGSIPAGSQVRRADSGVVYLTQADVALDASTVSVGIKASSDEDGGDGSGAIGNLSIGDVVSFANPLASIERDATVASIDVTGADAETTEVYRTRIINKFQARPQGGAYADYRDWATGVTGIINAYPYTGDTAGEIDVYVEATEASSGSADGIPTGAQLTEVAAAIQLDVAGKASRRPVGAAVNVYAITRSEFDITVIGLDVPDEVTVKANISTGVDEHLRTRDSFITGLSVLPRDARVTLAAVGGVIDGIVNAAGGAVGQIILEKSSVVLIAYTVGKGERAKLGAIDYA